MGLQSDEAIAQGRETFLGEGKINTVTGFTKALHELQRNDYSSKSQAAIQGAGPLGALQTHRKLRHSQFMKERGQPCPRGSRQDSTVTRGRCCRRSFPRVS